MNMQINEYGEYRNLTDTIDKDEKCFLLRETIRKTPDSKAFHRYQVITVMRNDEFYDHWHDMGDASLYQCEDLFDFAIFEKTVGQCIEDANDQRNMSMCISKFRSTDPKEELVKKFINNIEIKRKRKLHKNYKQYGYGG